MCSPDDRDVWHELCNLVRSRVVGRVVAMSALPIKFQELVLLTNVGIAQQSISYASLTMQSEKYICVCEEEVNGQVQVVIIDMATPTKPQRRRFGIIDSAIMNPISKVIALKAGNYLQIFNMETEKKIKSHQVTEPVLFWKWISPAAVAMVTTNAVFHWPMEGMCSPGLVFLVSFSRRRRTVSQRLACWAHGRRLPLRSRLVSRPVGAEEDLRPPCDAQRHADHRPQDVARQNPSRAHRH